jgi:hypothetical protein
MLLGLIVAVFRSQARPALIIPLATLALLIPAALLVGQVPRYRYPADPMMAVLVGGGVSGIFWLFSAALARLRAARQTQTPDLAPASAMPSSGAR